MKSGTERESIFSVVTACLLDFGYEMEHLNDFNDLRFWIRTERKVWRAQFVINPEAHLLRLYVFLTDPTEYPEDLKQDVMELAARLNEKVVIGTVGVAWDEGVVFFRSALDLRRTAPTRKKIEDLLNTSAYPVGLWETALEFLQGGGGAQIALEASLIVN